MRISLNWLKTLVDIPYGPEELAERMTMLGLEIEALERPWEKLTQVFVGQIVSMEPHPQADKLTLCKTDVGSGEPLQIVCGARNMKPGDKVPTAVVGATLPSGMEIGRRKMRGLESFGMMCSATELGLGEDHSGLLILDPSAPIGEDIVKHLGLDDAILEIEVTPNRGDWASMIGVARELAAAFGSPLRMPELDLVETAPDVTDLSSVVIENADLCPRYVGRVLTGVSNSGQTPLWMKSRLLAAGLRPISPIVDVTNYVLLECGQPLHAFDLDKLNENRIVVRNAKPGEHIVTIDKIDRPLVPEMLVIADAQVPVAIAGIMGGFDSEVTEETTRVFLESAFFNPVCIRRTARKLGMQTEASAHFQRGADPEMAVWAADRAARLMSDLTGASVCLNRLDDHPSPLVQPEVTLRYARADLLLGINVPPSDQVSFLEGLGFEVLDRNDSEATFKTPSWRHDVKMEADLIEEVARLWGFEKIPTTLPSVRQTEERLPSRETVLRHFKQYIAGQGLTEFFSWTFSCQQEVIKASLPPSRSELVAISNPLNENLAAMRTSLLPGMLTSIARNLNHGVTDVSAFEIGSIYLPVQGQELPSEQATLVIALLGGTGEKHWSRPEQAFDFYDLKGYCEVAIDYFGLAPAFSSADIPPFLDKSQSGGIVLDGQTVGSLGLVSEKVCRAFDINRPVYFMELELEPLLASAKTYPRFAAIPKFPPSLRDMALLVDTTTEAGSMLDAARQAGGKLLTDASVFDVYSGKQLPQGKKSIALSLVFQSADKTLTDVDTQKAFDRIVQALAEQFGAALR